MIHLAVCACGHGITGDNRDNITAELRDHMTGPHCTAAIRGLDRTAWTGTADTRLSTSVKTEAL